MKSPVCGQRVIVSSPAPSSTPVRRVDETSPPLAEREPKNRLRIAFAMNSTSRTLRRNQTDAESLLWRHLRNRQLGGFKFRRQHSFAPYIVDFVCIEKLLIVELDGGQHAIAVEADERRTKLLEQKGFRVIRFWNNQILGDTEAVLERILELLN
jgi:very-short-patch-repair endonuclease